MPVNILLRTTMTFRIGGFLLSLLFFLDASAYDFVERSRGMRIYYSVVSEESRTVEVARGDEWDLYEGSYTIPRVVTHKGKRYRVVAIGKRAFADCDEVRNITFPSNITRIDSAAFSHCESLTRLNLPPKLKYIGDHAFAFCSFPYVKIPASVNHIGRGVFSYCPYVVDILVDEKNSTYTDGGGCSCIIDKTFNTIIQGCAGTIVSNDIRRIGDEAFAGCDKLDAVLLPDILEEIGEEAFRGSGLKSVVIPDGVTDLHDRTFFNCTALQSITLPRRLLSIGSKVFFNCRSLKHVVARNYDPLTLDNGAFPEEVYRDAELKVPIGCDESYRKTDGWTLFVKIVE